MKIDMKNFISEHSGLKASIIAIDPNGGNVVGSGLIGVVQIQIFVMI